LTTGKTRARDAALNAIQSPLLDIGIERATGIVWNITGGSDLTLFEVGLLIGIWSFNYKEFTYLSTAEVLLFLSSFCVCVCFPFGNQEGVILCS
jgi:hypothetical protein